MAARAKSEMLGDPLRAQTAARRPYSSSVSRKFTKRLRGFNPDMACDSCRRTGLRRR
jgi:hypothetical protein